MQWLRDGRPGPGRGFSEIVDRVVPGLERAVAEPAAAGQRRADLLAHLGWARFLKSRDGVITADPAADYARALAADPRNAYAHAFWGHWILWQHGDLAAAMRHFADALTDGRAKGGDVRAWMRSLQVAALRNQRWPQKTVPHRTTPRRACACCRHRARWRRRNPRSPPAQGRRRRRGRRTASRGRRRPRPGSPWRS